MPFADITPFDWSPMIKGQEVKPSQPLSPVSDNDTNTVWLEGFLKDDQTVAPSVSSSVSGSPLEFSSLFDVGGDEIQQSTETESLFSSNTSLDNSPIVKTEDQLTKIPELTLSLGTITRNSSTTTLSSESSSTPTTKKPKKKRAPRKRLTAHQKQAHNKIEKRYRININAKIAGLQQIIPWVASEKTAFETGQTGSIKTEEETADVPRLNKSMILEKATAYILFLQEKEISMTSEIDKLKQEVSRLGGQC